MVYVPAPSASSLAPKKKDCTAGAHASGAAARRRSMYRCNSPCRSCRKASDSEDTGTYSRTLFNVVKCVVIISSSYWSTKKTSDSEDTGTCSQTWFFKTNCVVILEDTGTYSQTWFFVVKRVVILEDTGTYSQTWFYELKCVVIWSPLAGLVKRPLQRRHWYIFSKNIRCSTMRSNYWLSLLVFKKASDSEDTGTYSQRLFNVVKCAVIISSFYWSTVKESDSEDTGTYSQILKRFSLQYNEL